MSEKIILESGLLNLSVEEILKKRLTSKKWRDIIDKSDYLWEKLIQRDFELNTGVSKKNLYMQLNKSYTIVSKERVDRLVKYLKENGNVPDFDFFETFTVKDIERWDKVDLKAKGIELYDDDFRGLELRFAYWSKNKKIFEKALIFVSYADETSYFNRYVFIVLRHLYKTYDEVFSLFENVIEGNETYVGNFLSYLYSNVKKNTKKWNIYVKAIEDVVYRTII